MPYVGLGGWTKPPPCTGSPSNGSTPSATPSVEHLLKDLGNVLHELRRFDEAREVLTAALAIAKLVGRAAESWNAWTLLEAVERDSGHPDAAHRARQEALQTYRTYRSHGGEPMVGLARTIAGFALALRDAGPGAARAFLAKDRTGLPPEHLPVLRALEAIADGGRSPTLADIPSLFPTLAVELSPSSSNPSASPHPTPRPRPRAPSPAFTAPAAAASPSPFATARMTPDRASR